jgi:hypothetical protein
MRLDMLPIVAARLPYSVVSMKEPIGCMRPNRAVLHFLSLMWYASTYVLSNRFC